MPPRRVSHCYTGGREGAPRISMMTHGCITFCRCPSPFVTKWMKCTNSEEAGVSDVAGRNFATGHLDDLKPTRYVSLQHLVDQLGSAPYRRLARYPCRQIGFGPLSARFSSAELVICRACSTPINTTLSTTNVRASHSAETGSTTTEETLPRSFEINFLTDIKLNKRVLLRSILIILHNAAKSPGWQRAARFGSAMAFSRPPHPTKVRFFSAIPAADPF